MCLPAVYMLLRRNNRTVKKSKPIKEDHEMIIIEFPSQPSCLRLCMSFENTINTENPVLLTALQGKARKTRKECEYSTEERSVLAKYKDQYRHKTTSGDRALLLRNHILPDIFNFWHNQGVTLDAEETPKRIKVGNVPY